MSDTLQESPHEPISGSLHVPEGDKAGERTKRLLRELNKTKDQRPVVCLTGETGEPFDWKGNDTDVFRVVSEAAVEGENFSIILHYNAAGARFDFPDDASKQCLEDLNLDIKDGGEQNIITDLLDPTSPNTFQRTDRFLFLIVEQLIERIKADSSIEKGCCIIIDRAEFLFPNGGASASAEKLHNEALIGDLNKLLQDTDGHRIILIDRSENTTKNPTLRREILLQAVPLLTRQDVAKVIQDEGFDPSNELLALARGISVGDLRELLQSSETDTVLTRLKEAKERAIENQTGGLIRCKTQPLTEDQVHMAPSEWKLWRLIKKQIHENPDLVSDMILVGPPGTGKSARAELLASMLGITFLEVNDISSSGLRGRKEDKVRMIFETAKRNKPCVLLWDELDKAVPKTEGVRVGSTSDNDDAEVCALIQREIGSKDMEGVVVLGAANDSDQMNSAFLRSGRWGLRIAVLAPEAMTERVELAKRMKNQIPALCEVHLDDDFFTQMLLTIPEAQREHINGADILSIFRNGLNWAAMEGEGTIEGGLLYAAKRFENPLSTEEIERFISVAKAQHTHLIRPWEDYEEDDQTDEELETLFEIGAIRERLREKEKGLKDIASEIEKMKRELEQLTGQRDKNVDIIRELADEIRGKRKEKKRVVSEAEAKLKAAETELERVKKQLAETQDSLSSEIEPLEKRLADLRKSEEKTATAITALERERKLVQGDLSSMQQLRLQSEMSKEARRLQELAAEQGATVVEIKEKDVEGIVQFLRSDPVLARLGEDCLSDHGNRLQHMPLDIRPGIYIIQPRLARDTFNQTWQFQLGVTRDRTIHFHKPLKDIDEIYPFAHPSVGTLLFLALQNERALMEGMPEGAEWQLRSQTRVPDIEHYQNIEDDERKEAIVGQFYEVELEVDPGDQDFQPELMIDINSDHGAVTAEMDADGNPKSKEWGLTSLLEIYRAPLKPDESDPS